MTVNKTHLLARILAATCGTLLAVGCCRCASGIHAVCLSPRRCMLLAALVAPSLRLGTQNRVGAMASEEARERSRSPAGRLATMDPPTAGELFEPADFKYVDKTLLLARLLTKTGPHRTPPYLFAPAPRRVGDSAARSLWTRAARLRGTKVRTGARLAGGGPLPGRAGRVDSCGSPWGRVPLRSGRPRPSPCWMLWRAARRTSSRAWR